MLSFQIFIDVPETQNLRRLWLRRSRVIRNNCKCFNFRVYLNHLLCIRNAWYYMQFAKREGNLVELTFAKTPGTVTWDRKKLSNSWPLRPSNHPCNNSGTHFGSSPLLDSKVANMPYLFQSLTNLHFHRKRHSLNHRNSVQWSKPREER